MQGHRSEARQAPERAERQKNLQAAIDAERLLPLEIEALPEGTYRKYRLNQILSGAPDGQIKDFILAPSDDDWNTFIGKAVGQ